MEKYLTKGWFVGEDITEKNTDIKDKTGTTYYRNQYVLYEITPIEDNTGKITDITGKITDITDKTGTTYWKNQYVLGDYEITPIEDKQKEDKVKITCEGKEVEISRESAKALNLIN